MSSDAESWAHKHARENPGHQAREGLDDPGSCHDCAERSPAYNLTEKDAGCSRCGEVVGTVITERGRATIRLSTSSHGNTLPISCPNVFPSGGDQGASDAHG